MPVRSTLALVIVGVLAHLLVASSVAVLSAQEAPQNLGALELSVAHRQALEPPDTHRWTLALSAGDLAGVDVRQHGIDVVVRVFDPTGAPRREIDSPTGSSGTEAAEWIVDDAGEWVVEVAPFEGSPAGAYEIEWVTSRAATEADRQLAQADSLVAVAVALYDERRFDEAEPLFEQVLTLREAALGSDHTRVADALVNLVAVYSAQNRHAEAVPLYRRALAVYESAVGPDAPAVAEILNGMAVLYWDLGWLSEVEPALERALRIYETTLGPEDPKVGLALYNLSAIYYEQGRFTESGEAAHRAVDIWRASLGPNHPNVVIGVTGLADVYGKLGRYEEAEAFGLRALALYESAGLDDQGALTKSLNNLAAVYYDQGRYAEAELLFRRALAVREEALGPEHLMVAQSLYNLATLYHAQGRYAEAEPLFLRRVAIYETIAGSDHHEVARTISNLATLYVDQGRYREAEPLLLRALSIRETMLGPDNPDVAEGLELLAALYRAEGRYEEAEPPFRRALGIRLSTFGPDHLNVAETESHIAALYFLQGRYLEAVALLDSAIAIFDESSGQGYARVQAYGLRARVRWELSDREGALADLADALRQVEELRPQIGGGEETRASQFGRYSDSFDLMVSWELAEGDVESAFEYAERGRSRVLLDQLAAGKVDVRSSIPVDVWKPLEERETTARASLAETQQRITLLRSREDLSGEERLGLIAALEDTLQAAESDYRQAYDEIKNASPLWRDLITSGGQPVALSTVQRQLVPEDGLLLLYQVGEKESYLFVVPPSGGEVEVIELELTTAALDTATADLLAALSDRSRGLGLGGNGKQSSMERLHALWQMLVPESVRARVLAASEVVVVPDGALHQVPFEALVVTPGSDAAGTRFWLDEGPVVRYAASATTLYNITQRPAVRVGVSGAGLLSLSNPIYDPGEVAELGAGAETPRAAADEGQAAAAGVRRNEYERAGGSLMRLPGTALETEAIEAAFGADRASGEVVVLQELDATEPELRGAVEGKRYLHLATHGTVDERRGALFASLALTPPAGETSDADDDGFLQLYEIYGLRLPEAELAVLSACETNVGTRVAGEGVFALSRGFLAAGARRVIASQWSVDDASTAALMGEFFGRIAAAEQRGERVDYSAALRDAKREVRSQAQWADPFYWAPFILTGKE